MKIINKSQHQPLLISKNIAATRSNVAFVVYQRKTIKNNGKNVNCTWDWFWMSVFRLKGVRQFYHKRHFFVSYALANSILGLLCSCCFEWKKNPIKVRVQVGSTARFFVGSPRGEGKVFWKTINYWEASVPVFGTGKTRKKESDLQTGLQVMLQCVLYVVVSELEYQTDSFLLLILLLVFEVLIFFLF